MGNPFVWSKKVPQAWIARLYEADGNVPDEALADKVGWALAARCDSIIAVTMGFETKKLPCPKCGKMILLSEGMFRCPCGFAAAWEQFQASYKNKQLYGANAMPVFRRFRKAFPQAQTYREKMSAIDTLIHNCLLGITANEEHCRYLLDHSVCTVTALTPHIGYKHAATIAKTALKTNKTIRELVLEEGIMDEAKLDEVLDPYHLTVPGAGLR